MLGGAVTEALARLVPGCRAVALDRRALDVRDGEAVLRCRGYAPDFIVHCAGDALADRCEQDPDGSRAVHIDGTAHVIELARACSAQVIYPQSVFIFDGRELPVTETTKPAPMSVYGCLKLAAEQRLLAARPDSLVIRMAGFFGGGAVDKNFVGSFTRWLFDAVGRGERGNVVGTRIWQPTYTRDLAANVLLLAALGRQGVYHMGAHGEASFYDVACACVDDLGLRDRMRIEKRPAPEPALEIAPRPTRMVTANRRLADEGLDRQRDWRSALREYLETLFFRERARAALQGR